MNGKHTPQPDYAKIEIRPSFDTLTAWTDGKYLGVVYSGDDGVFVCINRQHLCEMGRKMKSASALQDSVEHSEGGTSSLC